METQTRNIETQEKDTSNDNKIITRNDINAI